MHHNATPPSKRINVNAQPKNTQPKDASSILPTPPKVSAPASNKRIATGDNPTATSNSHSNKDIDPANAKPQVAISIPPVAKSYWPSNLIKIIKSVVATISPKPTPPLFMFEMSSEAAHKNYCIFKKRFNNDIKQAILVHKDSPLGYRSEFQKSTTLAPSCIFIPTGCG